MEVIRAKSLAQRAGAFYVRIHGMAVKHHISLEEEFDEHDGDDTHYIVVLDDILPVATVRMYALSEKVAAIGRVVVLPEYRRRGIGACMIREAEDWAKELGFTKIRIDSRDNKTAFYEALGYTPTGEAPICNDVFTCIPYEKTL